MEKSLILFDIDGTILKSETNQIPSSTILAIQKLQQAGHDLGIATGRALFLVDERLKQLPFNTFVTANGQHITHKGEVIYENAIPTNVIDEFIEDAKNLNQVIGLLTANRATVTGNNEIVQESFKRVSIDFPEILPNLHKEEPILQAWYFCEDFAQLPKKYKEHLRFIPWLNFGADIVPVNGSKAEGIKALIEYMEQKPEKVIAFGDGYNDIEMLQLADIGVAMGNASDEVKSYADFVTKSIDEDCIYYACEQLGLF